MSGSGGSSTGAAADRDQAREQAVDREQDREQDLDRELAERMREEAAPLARRWLDRISERLDLEPEVVFPSRDLLDHVPLLLEGIAATLVDDVLEPEAEMPLVRKAREIGALRFDQGCSLHELVKELQILEGILAHFLTERVGDEGRAADGWRLATRLNRAMAAVRAAALHAYATGLKERLADGQRRLRSAHRIVTHDVGNRLTAALGTLEVLPEGSDEEQERMLDALRRQLEALRTAARNLRLITYPEDGRQEGHVSLRAAAQEAVRQVRGLADAGGVQVMVDDDLPEIEAPAAVVELALVSYLSNAIHYADTGTDDRWVRVDGRVDSGSGTGPPRLVVRVRDNGIGVPEEDRDSLFDPFLRSEIAITRNVAGLGLGLSTVREVVEAYGGEAWAELDDGPGSTFLFSLPSRRQEDTDDR